MKLVVTQWESVLRSQRRLVLTWQNYMALLCRSVCQITETQRTELSAYCHTLWLLFTSSICTCTHWAQRAGFLILNRILRGFGLGFWPMNLCSGRVWGCWWVWQIKASIPSSPPMNKNTDWKWTLVWPSTHTHTITYTHRPSEVKCPCRWKVKYVAGETTLECVEMKWVCKCLMVFIDYKSRCGHYRRCWPKPEPRCIWKHMWFWGRRFYEVKTLWVG